MSRRKKTMKNGDKFNIILFSFIFGQFIGNLKNKRKHKVPQSKTQMHHYLNRFTEFYDSRHLIFVEDEFYGLINMGFSPEVAFNLMIHSENTYD